METMTQGLTKVNPRRAILVHAFLTDPNVEDSPELPPATLREVFMHLWSRLDDVSWRAKMAAQTIQALTPQEQGRLNNIAALTDVSDVYGHMCRVLAEAQAKVRTTEDGLRDQVANLSAQLAELFVENARLRARAVEVH